MNTQTPQPVPAVAPVAVLRADLSNLVDESRHIATVARRLRLTRVLRHARANGFAFDAAVNILDTLGSEYALTAEALVTAGHAQLGALRDALYVAHARPMDAVRERIA